ncbi:MAG: LapA family protein [Pontixanthobacter sp.]
MQIVRTIFLILLSIAVVGFVFLNWGESHPVRIWPGGPDNTIMFDWPVGFIALVFAILGFIPAWLLYRGTKWRLTRRIRSLENAAKAAAVSGHYDTDRDPLHGDRADAGIPAAETALAGDPATTTIRPVTQR